MENITPQFIVSLYAVTAICNSFILMIVLYAIKRDREDLVVNAFVGVLVGILWPLVAMAEAARIIAWIIVKIGGDSK